MTGRSSDIVRRAFMNLSKAETARRGCRSTPRTASTARPATSRTRPRTSIGSRPKAEEDRTIPICRWLACTALAATIACGAPAAAARYPAHDNPALTYVQARAAAMSGEHGRSAELLAQLADANQS